MKTSKIENCIFICVFSLPAPYGTSISRMPVNMGPSRQHGFMMDPHAGKLKVNIYFLYVIYVPKLYNYPKCYKKYAYARTTVPWLMLDEFH